MILVLCGDILRWNYSVRIYINTNKCNSNRIATPIYPTYNSEALSKAAYYDGECQQRRNSAIDNLEVPIGILCELDLLDDLIDNR